MAFAVRILGRPLIKLVTPLLWVAAAIVAYGLLQVYRGKDESPTGSIKGLLLWLAGVVGWLRIGIPGHSKRVLGPLADAIVYVTHAIDRLIGVAYDLFTAPVAAYWHTLAEVPIQTANSLAWFTSATVHKFEWIEREYVPGFVKRELTSGLVPLGVALAALHVLHNSTIPGLRHRIDGLRAATLGALAAVTARLTVVYHATTVTLPHRIATLGDVIGRTARQARAHARRLHRLEGLLASGAFAAAVAVALGRLGLKWTRCGSLNRLGRRVGCAPWAMLEDAFLGSFVALAATDLCRWATLIGASAEQAVPLFLELVDVENALIGCHGNTAPAPLRVTGYTATPLVDAVSLAA